MPNELKDVIAKCWHRYRAARPKAIECFDIADQCVNLLSNSDFDIFLSHPWTTKPVMRQVKRHLNNLGYKVWYDEIPMQWDLKSSMRDGIMKSKVVLACISTAFEKSNFCMFELNEAKNNNKVIFALVTGIYVLLFFILLLHTRGFKYVLYKSYVFSLLIISCIIGIVFFW